MEITCPNCGEVIAVRGLGRKRLSIPVVIVYDALQACKNTTQAAKKLGCSRAFIYKVLKQENLTVEDAREKGGSLGIKKPTGKKVKV